LAPRRPRCVPRFLKRCRRNAGRSSAFIDLTGQLPYNVTPGAVIGVSRAASTPQDDTSATYAEDLFTKRVSCRARGPRCAYLVVWSEAAAKHATADDHGFDLANNSGIAAPGACVSGQRRRLRNRLNRMKIATALAAGVQSEPDLDPIVLSIEAKLQRAGKGKSLIIENGASIEVNERLVELIKEAFAIRNHLLSGSDAAPPKRHLAQHPQKGFEAIIHTPSRILSSGSTSWRFRGGGLMQPL
jgi:hypothetical protein